MMPECEPGQLPHSARTINDALQVFQAFHIEPRVVREAPATDAVIEFGCSGKLDVNEFVFADTNSFIHPLLVLLIPARIRMHSLFHANYYQAGPLLASSFCKSFRSPYCLVMAFWPRAFSLWPRR